MLENNKKDKISIFKIYKTIIPIFLEKSKKDILLVAIIGILLGLTMLGVTMSMERFFDNATGLANGTATFTPVIISGLILMIIFILSLICNTIINSYGTKLIGVGASNFMTKVNKKSARIETIKFEDTKTLDDINKAQIGCQYAVVMILLTVFIITGYIGYFTFMGIYLYSMNPILSLAIVIAFIPAIFNQYMRTSIFAKLENESANLRREFEHNEKCIIDREYFKETRILGAFGYFNKKYNTSLDKLNEKAWKAEKRASMREFLSNSMTAVGYSGVLFLMFISIIEGKITIGAFGAILAALGTLFSMAEELFGQQITEITRGIASVRNLINFLNIEEDKRKDINIDTAPSIEIKNVSFSYPESEKLILNNVSLDIKEGETIAIVGENGSGKTTFMRVLLGLYPPTSGDVLINNYNTKEVSAKSILKNSSAVFQKFNRYKFELDDNVSIADINNKSEERILKVLDEANIDIQKEKFSEGLKTNLSKEFGGIDLSGGEWQRVAIARGLYKFSNLIVLDEPTAAIDPVEEGRIFTRFKEVSKDKTSIIVTHRMGTVKIADRIVVLDKGEIVQVGTHEQLINMEGNYKEMYISQSQWYDREEEIAIETEIIDEEILENI